MPDEPAVCAGEEAQEGECKACGGVINLRRKHIHDQFWCPSRSRDTDTVEEEDESKEDSGGASSAHIRAACMQPTFHNIITVNLGSMPLSFRLEQQDIFGPLSTGGALWAGELVLAEWLVLELEHLRGKRSQDWPLKVVELGCGSCPVAGMVAAALGCREVVLTDLREVLPAVRHNVGLNRSALVEAATQSFRTLGHMRVEELSWGAHACLGGGSDTDTPLDLVICSDCVFRKDLHPLLADTLLSLLLPGSAALLAYQQRDTEVEAAFFCELDQRALAYDRLDLNEVLEVIRGSWLQESADAASPPLEECYRLFCITAA
uniref:C2HC zinc finger plants domain-containing protein n=1 Tax=Eutreptiella gymnastica TaxID=73025 RepID=A0A7S1NIU1_9EUGL